MRFFYFFLACVLLLTLALAPNAWAQGDPTPETPPALGGAPPSGEATVYVPGPPGPAGPQGPPGRPPTEAEIQEALVAYLDSANTAPAPGWAKPALEEAVAQGLVVGYPNGTYRWARPATRAEVAIVVERAWVKTQAALEKLDGRIDAVEEANRRQDTTLVYLLREFGLLKQDQEDLRGLLDSRSWLFLLLVAAAFFATAAGIRRLRNRP